MAKISEDKGVWLSGAGLTLRPWRSGDELAVFRALNDPDIERVMTAIPLSCSAVSARIWVRQLAPAAWLEGGAEFALDLGDGLAVGSLGVRRQVRPGGAVGLVDYWVAPTARGRGLAGQALRLAAPWAAMYLRLVRQELVHDLANVASCRAAVAGGFQADGAADAGRFRDGTPRDVERHTWTASNESVS